MTPSADELSDVAAMLEEHRARLTDSERDDVRRRATASRPAPARRNHVLRGRAAITSMLAAGLVMTSGGAALGVSALSETHSAKAAQYGVSADQSGTAGATGSGSAANSGAGDNVGTLGGAAQQTAVAGGQATRSAGRSADRSVQTAPVQAARQLESGNSELPFTGYLAGFVLLAGLATLAVGLALRRGTRRAPTRA